MGMTNKEFYFGDDLRLAASLKAISECCANTLCGDCIIQEPCCQAPAKFYVWLNSECEERLGSSS